MKKIFTFLLFSFCALLVSAQTTYTFDSSNYDAVKGTTISATTTIDGLTFNASSGTDQGVKFNSGAVTYSSTEYSRYAELRSTGDWTSTPPVPSISFSVTGACSIYVVCASAGSSDRTLKIGTGESSVLGTISAPAKSGSDYTPYGGTVSYTGNGGTIYIWSGEKQIRLYTIVVTYSSGQTTGIKEIPFGAEVVSTEYYNISGTMVGSETTSLKTGVYIKKVTYDTGDVTTSKISIIR